MGDGVGQAVLALEAKPWSLKLNAMNKANVLNAKRRTPSQAHVW